MSALEQAVRDFLDAYSEGYDDEWAEYVARLRAAVDSEPTQKPRLMRSPLTGTVYLVTRYTTYGDPAAGLIEAQEKYPVDRDELADVIRQTIREPDNHHNAAVCPYCTPRLPRLDPRSIDNGGTHG